MKILTFLLLLVQSAVFAGEDLEFFESRYKVEIKGVKALSEYDDPDSFYSAIAAKLKIPQIAFDAVAKKYGWKKDGKKVQQAIVRRSEGNWILMIYQIQVDPETRKPDMETMQQKWAVVDDDKKVVYVGERQPTKQIVEQGGDEQPATAPESKPTGDKKSKSESEGRSQ